MAKRIDQVNSGVPAGYPAPYPRPDTPPGGFPLGNPPPVTTDKRMPSEDGQLVVNVHFPEDYVIGRGTLQRRDIISIPSWRRDSLSGHSAVIPEELRVFISGDRAYALLEDPDDWEDN